MIKKLALLIVLTFLLSLTLVSSQSLEPLKPIEKGSCGLLKYECLNCSWVNISSVTYPNNSIALGEVEMVKSGITFTYNFCDTDTLGIYTFCGYSDATDNIPFCRDLPVTPNGEVTTSGNSIIYIGLLFIFLFLLAFSIIGFYKLESVGSKAGTLGISYLLLMAVSFIAWNMAEDFITSSPFLIEMFRIIFMVLMIGLFPLLIGAFAFYIIMLTKVKEIERLMTKGFSQDEAQRRSS